MSEQEGREAGVNATVDALEELKKQNQELQEALKKEQEEKDHIKKSQSGSDAAVRELQDRIKELQSNLEAKMDEKELAARKEEEKEKELQTLRDKMKEIENSARQDKLKSFVVKRLSELELDPSLSDIIDVESEEQAELKIKKIKESFDQKAQQQIKSIMNQSAPRSGEQDGVEKPKRGKTPLETLANL